MLLSGRRSVSALWGGGVSESCLCCLDLYALGAGDDKELLQSVDFGVWMVSLVLACQIS